MKATVAACSFLLALLVASSAGASADPLMKPGKWQIEIKVKIVGSPSEIPPKQVTQCITPEQAEHPDPSGGQNGDCQMSDYKIEGKVVTWTVTCEKQHMKGHGTITYDLESYEGFVDLRSDEIAITQEMKGQRVGECDPAE